MKKAHKDHGWEEFSRGKLLAGELLRRYYPLHKDAWPEYEAWLAWRTARRNNAGAAAFYQLVTEPSLRTRWGASHCL